MVVVDMPDFNSGTSWAHRGTKVQTRVLPLEALWVLHALLEDIVELFFFSFLHVKKN